MTDFTLWLLTCATISVASTFLCCEAFLLVDNCPAPAPCTCSGSGSSYAYIFCNSKGLNTTPHFLQTGTHVAMLDVSLYGNHLITIPDYAFKNLSSFNASTIQLRLFSNKISTISRYAFSGIENEIDYLDLDNNNLSSIPKSVGDLRALKTLLIQDNPLTSLGASTLSEIGHTLQVLHIDLKEFSAWPTEFGYLHTLKTLHIQNMNFSNLNSGAFQGFESSLTSLSIQYAAKLDKLPNAVCHLSNLKTLTLQYFNNLNGNSTSLFDHCTQKLNKVTALAMRYNHLKSFPDVFHIFPSITSLYLLGNSLDIIESEKIPIDNVLSSIDLDSNSFKRIPNALNILKRLTYLDLRNNDIFSIEDHDLIGLVRLKKLNLNNDPIKYISNHAFSYNRELASLFLIGTNLKIIPAAIMTLPKLSTFGIGNTQDQIHCTCDMSYLKDWNATAVSSFNGQCAFSSINIQTYIMTSLQQCP